MSIGRINSESFIVLGDRLVSLSQVEIGDAEMGQSVDIIRLQFEGALIGLLGLGKHLVARSRILLSPSVVYVGVAQPKQTGNIVGIRLNLGFELAQIDLALLGGSGLAHDIIDHQASYQEKQSNDDSDQNPETGAGLLFLNNDYPLPGPPGGALALGAGPSRCAIGLAVALRPHLCRSPGFSPRRHTQQISSLKLAWAVCVDSKEPLAPASSYHSRTSPNKTK